MMCVVAVRLGGGDSWLVLFRGMMDEIKDRLSICY